MQGDHRTGRSHSGSRRGRGRGASGSGLTVPPSHCEEGGDVLIFCRVVVRNRRLARKTKVEVARCAVALGFGEVSKGRDLVIWMMPEAQGKHRVDGWRNKIVFRRTNRLGGAGRHIDAGWGKGGLTAYRDGRQLDRVRLQRRRGRGGARGRPPGEARSGDGGGARSRGDWRWREAGSGAWGSR